jgi:hypothetical protein
METGVEKIDSRQTYNYRYIQKLSSIGVWLADFDAE